jgi:hypothetical protein
METAIDVRELPEDEVELVQEFVEFLKQRATTRRTQTKNKRVKRIVFSAHRSDVIGDLRRRQIYEDV